MSGIRIATINTQTGRLLKDPDGLHIFARRLVDVLLLQEVFGTKKSAIDRRLRMDGYRLVAFNQSTGLAIAILIDSELSILQNSVKLAILQESGRVAKLMVRKNLISGHHVRERGALMLEVRTTKGQKIVVATTHPAVFIRHRSRTEHLRLLHQYLTTTYHVSQPLLLGADMNHYPGPGRFDIAFRERGGFKEVPIGDTTWSVTGTKYEQLARIAARLSRQQLSAFNGRLDTILYRGAAVRHLETQIIPIASDHRAIISYFSLP